MLTNAHNVIGLDYSSKALYVDSLGLSADYPKYYRKMEAKLKREQRKLSKRMKGGKNRNKQREKVAKLHEKVANQRKDFLQYKLIEQGKQLVIIDKWYPSSKICHVCGEINNELTLADRFWVCSCGAEHDRDINAAINIKNEGCRILGIA